MIVVSDTSPLTALMKIGRADLLQLLFAEVLIPPAVESELRRSHAALPDWLTVRTPSFIPENVLDANLDPGETEALALALDANAEIVLMDERLGRAVARSLGLKPTGLLGCLALAKDEGLILEMAPLISELQKVAGCWFDERLVVGILREMGEAQ